MAASDSSSSTAPSPAPAPTVSSRAPSLDDDTAILGGGYRILQGIAFCAPLAVAVFSVWIFAERIDGHALGLWPLFAAVPLAAAGRWRHAALVAALALAAFVGFFWAWPELHWYPSYGSWAQRPDDGVGVAPKGIELILFAPWALAAVLERRLLDPPDSALRTARAVTLVVVTLAAAPVQLSRAREALIAIFVGLAVCEALRMVLALRRPRPIMPLSWVWCGPALAAAAAALLIDHEMRASSFGLLERFTQWLVWEIDHREHYVRYLVTSAATTVLVVASLLSTSFLVIAVRQAGLSPSRAFCAAVLALPGLSIPVHHVERALANQWYVTSSVPAPLQLTIDLQRLVVDNGGALWLSLGLGAPLALIALTQLQRGGRALPLLALALLVLRVPAYFVSESRLLQGERVFDAWASRATLGAALSLALVVLVLVVLQREAVRSGASPLELVNEDMLARPPAVVSAPAAPAARTASRGLRTSLLR